jgi:hypothetical protein
MNCLPDGYETLVSEKKYLKLSQLKDGDNKLRIVSKPIGGWVDWKDNKPLRYRSSNKPKSSVDPTKPMKAFWAFQVWDYGREDLFIMEVVQQAVIKTLTLFACDKDIGDFTLYDIKVIKTGSNKETRYQIMPLQPKPLADKIQEAIDSRPVRLEALFEGGDPWLDLEPLTVHKVTGEAIINEIEDSDTPLNKVEKIMEERGLETHLLNEYFKMCAEKTKEPIDNLIAQSLDEKNIEAIARSYAKYLDKVGKPAE